MGLNPTPHTSAPAPWHSAGTGSVHSAAVLSQPSGAWRPSRLRSRWAWALLFLALAVLAWEAWRMQRAAALDAAVAQVLQQAPGQIAALPSAAPPRLRHARAHALALAERHDAALEAYRPLQADPALGLAARYNSANILMRQAQVQRAGEAPGQAIPMLELAKELYREVLRAEPGHWSARYNLERAQRLLPDPEPVDTDTVELPRARERAATTVRGIAQGMP